MASRWTKILAFTSLLIGLTTPDLVAATASPNIPITVNVDTQSEVVFYWDLIQYASYNWQVQYQEGGAAKDMSSNSSAKLVAKLYEHAINGDTNTVFEVEGDMGDSADGLIVYPITAGLCDDKGKMRFEFQSYDGADVSTRFYIDLFVVQGTDTGDNGGWTPPQGSDDYYTKPEIDAMLTYMAEWSQSETWNDATKVDFFDATVRNALFVDTVTNLTGQVIFDDTQVQFQGTSKTVIFDTQAYFNSPVTMNNQLTVDAEATVESNMIINGTLDVSGAKIIGNLFENDVFEVKTPVAAAMSASASAAAVAGSMVFDDPVIFNSNVTANASLSVGDMTVGNLTGSTDPWTLAGAADVVLRPGSGGNLYLGKGIVSHTDIAYSSAETSGIRIGGEDGWPVMKLRPDSTGTRFYFWRNPHDTFTDVWYNYTANTVTSGIAHRFYQARSIGTASSYYLQIGDTALNDYLRLRPVSAPLAIGSNTPADASTPAAGDIIFTNPVFAEQKMWTGEIETDAVIRVKDLNGVRAYDGTDDSKYLEMKMVGSTDRYYFGPATGTQTNEMWFCNNVNVSYMNFNPNPGIPMRASFNTKDSTGTTKTFRINDTVAHDYFRIEPAGQPLVIGSNAPVSAGSAGDGDTVFSNPVYFDQGIGADLTVKDQVDFEQTATRRGFAGFQPIAAIGGSSRMAFGYHSNIDYSGTIYFGPDMTGTTNFSHFAFGINSDPTRNWRLALYQHDSVGAEHALTFGDYRILDYHRIVPSGMPLAIGLSDASNPELASAGDIIFTNPVFAESTVNSTANITTTAYLKGQRWQLEHSGLSELVQMRYHSATDAYQWDQSGTLTNGITKMEFFAPTTTATSIEEINFFPGGHASHATRVGIGHRNSSNAQMNLFINDTTTRDYLRINPSAGPLAIGSATMTSSPANGEVAFTTSVFFESDTTTTGAAYFNSTLTANSDLTVDGNLDVSLHAAFNGTVGDLQFAAGDSVINGTGGNLDIVTSGSLAEYVNIRSRALRVWDRDDTDYFQIFGADNSKSFYVSSNGLDPATDPASLYFFPCGSGLGGDKGLTTISWSANVGDNRPGLQGLRYQWRIPHSDGTTTGGLQLGASTSEDYVRLQSITTGYPILFGTGSLTAGTISPTRDTVAFSEDVVIEGDLEIKGDIFESAGSTDARIAYAYTPGGGATDEVVIQFGETVLTGGSVTVPLGIAYKDTNYVAMATYQGTSTINWDAIAYTIVDADHITFTGETGQTITYQTTGFITP